MNDYVNKNQDVNRPVLDLELHEVFVDPELPELTPQKWNETTVAKCYRKKYYQPKFSLNSSSSLLIGWIHLRPWECLNSSIVWIYAEINFIGCGHADLIQLPLVPTLLKSYSHVICWGKVQTENAIHTFSSLFCQSNYESFSLTVFTLASTAMVKQVHRHQTIFRSAGSQYFRPPYSWGEINIWNWVWALMLRKLSF